MNDSYLAIPQYRIIRISGHDAQKFLQGQLTCDMREVNAQQSRLAAYCNHKGKVLAVMRVFYHDETYFLSVTASLAEKVLTTLKKYAVFSKIVIDDVSASYGAVGVFYSDHQEALPQQITMLSHSDEATTHNNLIYIRVPDQHVRYEIYGASTHIAQLTKYLTSSGFILTDETQWRLRNMQANIATIYPATSEQYTPHMLNLPALNVVSFNKGCYLGQEIIARTEHLGKTKRHLQRWVVETTQALEPGYKIQNGQGEESGTVIESAKIDEKKCLLLAIV